MEATPEFIIMENERDENFTAKLFYEFRIQKEEFHS
jgi:hypothetical protein